MNNKELIYDLAKRLDLIIEVKKDGKYIGKYKYFNNKLHKLNETRNDDNK